MMPGHTGIRHGPSGEQEVPTFINTQFMAGIVKMKNKKAVSPIIRFLESFKVIFSPLPTKQIGIQLTTFLTKPKRAVREIPEAAGNALVGKPQ